MYVETLKRLKKQSKMTTAEIAEKSGIPEPTLEKLFAGKTKRPTLQTVTKLAHLFGCTLDDLQSEAFEPDQKEIPSAPAATGTERISIEETDKLLAALGFIEDGEQLSDDDLLFLQSVVGLLDAWFKRKRK